MNRHRILTLAVLLLLLPVLAHALPPRSFKDEQLRKRRIRKAYEEKEQALLQSAQALGFGTLQNYLYIRVFKKEGEVEAWLSPKGGNGEFQLFKTYKLCAKSGGLGPKMKRRDDNIPEGFYTLTEFDARDGSDYAAMTISYPNAADLNRGADKGGQVDIRGGCDPDRGNMPLTEDGIKELYILAVEAKNIGQDIPVHIFPQKLSDGNFEFMQTEYGGGGKLLELWGSMKPAYDYFTYLRKLPQAQPKADGTYNVTTRYTKPADPIIPSPEPKPEPAPIVLPPVTFPEQPGQYTQQDYHTVTKGETLYAISKKYGVTVAQLIAWNKVRRNRIKSGQQLRITSPEEYVVVKGDTLYSIALRFGVTLKDLQTWNQKRNSIILIGEKLRLKEPAAARK